MKRDMTVLGLFFGLSLYAANANAQGGKNPPPPPPQEAIDACADLESGDACSFVDAKGNDVAGTCFAPDAQSELACKGDEPPPQGEDGDCDHTPGEGGDQTPPPGGQGNQPPPGQGGGQEGGGPKPPPQEAIDACADLAAGDACSFEDKNGEELAGTCFTPDADHPLACQPEDAPEGAEPQGDASPAPDSSGNNEAASSGSSVADEVQVKTVEFMTGCM